MNSVGHAPVFDSKGALSGKCGSDCVGGARKGGVQAIAGAFHQRPLVRCHHMPEQGIVPCERAGHGLGMLLPQPCAALDVRE